ncbi:hypothetical protein AB0I16_30520 [Streptomyces sp. NPDC050703]|uniref:hypothetical protein n=1 Tax=Streptomyces sp. NPDC050703 TaxID=3157218 RepID=UPI00343EF369
MLSQGEYPQDEDDADTWKRHEEARACRDDLIALWRDVQDRLVMSAEGLAACPWLRAWAEDRMAAHARIAEKLRQAVVPFYTPRVLAEAAAVAELPEPALTPDSAFGIFGDDASIVLRKVWRAWRASARSDAKPLATAALSAEAELHEALGRRRKGVDEAKQALWQLTETWAEQAQLTAAEQSAGRPWRLIGVRIPPRSPYWQDESSHEALTPWELAVVAVYQVAVDWHKRAAALWVPQGIGDQLRTQESSMEPVEAVDLLVGAEDWAAPAAALLAAWEPSGHGTRI